MHNLPTAPYRLMAMLEEMPARSIVVVGDLIADQFLYGEISRISREAPVLVLQYRDLVSVPGGAANAASNLLALGCRVKVLGQVGKDEAGSALVRDLEGRGADITGIGRLEGYETPVKTRILAGAHHSSPQQIVRLDRVPVRPLPPSKVGAKLVSAVSDADAVIISDYGLGAIQPESTRALIGACRERRIPLTVDSRFRMSDFSGVTALTPNITELEAAVGRPIGSDAALLAKVGRLVLRRQKLTCLLVTQGRFGMTLFQKHRAPVQIPIYGSDEVADVTGAGDTVIAVFTLALACGAAPVEAAHLANCAGGIVVMKRATATVTREELRRAVASFCSRPGGSSHSGA